MEVSVLTRRKGEYIFTEQEEGKWILYRHQRSYYVLPGPVEIRKFHSMRFVAQQYYPPFHQFGSFINIKSSCVKKILVDGVPVKNITINQ